MSCELPEETLFILKILYTGRCLSSNRGYHSEKLNKLYQKKYPHKGHLSFKSAIQTLLNQGYITKIRKKKDKYYISDIKKANLALITHGYITNNGLS